MGLLQYPSFLAPWLIGWLGPAFVALHWFGSMAELHLWQCLACLNLAGYTYHALPALDGPD